MLRYIPPVYHGFYEHLRTVGDGADDDDIVDHLDLDMIDDPWTVPRYCLLSVTFLLTNKGYSW